MLSRAIVLLTVASTLGHAVLGCCAHHVHAQDGAEFHETGSHQHESAAAHREQGSESADHDAGHSHGGHWHEPGLPLPDESHHHSDDGCDDPPCTYVVPDSARVVDAGDLPVTILPPAVALPVAADVPPYAHRAVLQISAPHSDSDSARGRSLLGVWLL